MSPGYFRSIGVPFIAGRDFEAADLQTSLLVAVVNRAFVHRLLSDDDALGYRISLGGGSARADIQIVGVVADFADESPGAEPTPKVFRPFTQARPQMGWHTANVTIQTARSTPAMSEEFRRAVLEAVPTAVVYGAGTLEERLDLAVAPTHQRALLCALLGVTAVALALTGPYGLITYSVAQSRYECGVRLALGATSHGLVRLMLWRGLRPATIGVAIGIGLAVAAGQRVTGIVPAASGLSLAPYLLTAVGLLTPVTLTSWLPARRISRANPLAVFGREE